MFDWFVLIMLAMISALFFVLLFVSEIWVY